MTMGKKARAVLQGTPFKRRLWLIGLVVISSLVLRGCFLRQATNFPGASFNRGTNAVWLGVEWVDQPHEADEFLDLIGELERQQVREVWVYTSYLKADGHFNPTYSNAFQFTQALGEARSEFNVQAWIGLPLGSVDLSDDAVRSQIVAFCVDLIEEEGFDGIHLDPEPILNDDREVLALLREVRKALGAGPILSIASRRIWPISPEAEWPLVGSVAWDARYYQEVADRVDQIAVMVYDSGLPLPFLYRYWTRFQVIEVSQALEGTGVELFFGVPTSEEWTLTHWPGAENMQSGLQGTVDGLNDAKTPPSVVTGVAIYPYWETDAAEWAVYRTLWLGQEDME
jgi:hypothetical protein